MTATPNPSAGFSFLVRNTAGRQGTFDTAFHILEQAISARTFPGCALAVTLRGELVAHHAVGRFTYDPAAPPVMPDSIFDLASVSKVVATTTMAMILYERGLLDLEAPVVAIVPEFATADPRRADVTVHMLLAHSSGLPAYEKLFLRARTRDELLAAAFTTDLSADPGTRAEYSDIGFIILGVALERLADEPLDTFCQREIFGPLGMAHTTFNPPRSWKDRIIPTADDQTFRHRIIQGEVQDENAWVLNGVAGHAGLFSNVPDLLRFANEILRALRPASDADRGGPCLFEAATIERFAERQGPEGSSRALGWDTPSENSSAGRHFSPRSIGHLGYSGCSLWIDLEAGVAIVLLTNRTWPDRKSELIRQVRPAFHDALREAL